MVQTKVTIKLYLSCQNCSETRTGSLQMLTHTYSTSDMFTIHPSQEEHWTLYNTFYRWTPQLHHKYQGMHKYIPQYSRRICHGFEPLRNAVEGDHQTKTRNVSTTATSLHEGRVLYERYCILQDCPRVIIFVLGQDIGAAVLLCWVRVNMTLSSRVIQPRYNLVPCCTNVAVQACHCSFIPYSFIISLVLLLFCCSPF